MSGVRANCRAMWSRENRAGNKSTDWGRERGVVDGKVGDRQGNRLKVNRKAKGTKESEIIRQWFETAIEF